MRVLQASAMSLLTFLPESSMTMLVLVDAGGVSLVADFDLIVAGFGLGMGFGLATSGFDLAGSEIVAIAEARLLRTGLSGRGSAFVSGLGVGLSPNTTAQSVSPLISRGSDFPGCASQDQLGLFLEGFLVFEIPDGPGWGFEYSSSRVGRVEG